MSSWKIHFPQIKLTIQRFFLLEKYRKRQFQLAGLLTVLDLSLLIPMKDSIFMMLFFVLLYITIAAGYLLQIRYIRKGHQLIIENNWQLTEQPIQVNTALVIEKSKTCLSLVVCGLIWTLASFDVCPS